MKSDLKTTSTLNGAEPSVNFKAVPVVIFLLIAILFFLGQLYLDRYAGGFNGKVYEPYESWKMVQDLNPRNPEEELFFKGKQLFGTACAGCHQASGMGSPGAYPPLAGSEWVLAEGPNRLVRIVVHGLAGPIKVKGVDWNLAMPGGFTDSMSNEDIASLLTYIRKEWGNNASAVRADQVEAIREQIKDRGMPWTAQELEAIPAQ